MLIVVEGCIGAGKSTVAKGLAEHRRSEALFESFESNPFLSAFYADPVACATETEFTFLLLHFHQLKTQTGAISRGELIADFHLGKDILYADLNLNGGKTRRIFNELYEVLAEEVPKPTLMVCLSASTELLIERIRKRQREIEMKIDPDYYARVNAAYENLFTRYQGQKLRISMDQWDFVHTPGLFRKLSVSIDEQIKSK